jgi:hypothetical protein
MEAAMERMAVPDPSKSQAEVVSKLEKTRLG